MKRILITGGSGMLGRAVSDELDRAGDYDLLRLSYSRSGDGLLPLDLTDEALLRERFAAFSPDCAIHCAAERRPDVSERDPQATTRLNVDATRSLAELCRASGAWLIYLSTDYVFDGAKPPYEPQDAPRPLNHYGASKLAGEEAVRQTLDDGLILRVPVLFGKVERLEESSVTTLVSAALSEQPVKLDHWAVRYPTYTGDVATTLRQLIEHRRDHPNFGGIYHWSGDEAFTKYEMALQLARLWDTSGDQLQPDSAPPSGAPRPRDCQLSCAALEALGIGKRTPFAEALEIATRPFRNRSRPAP